MELEINTTKKRTNSTMTKLELLEALKEFNDEDEIYVAIQTGDYWRHVAVKPVTKLESTTVKYSDYLQSFELISDDDANFRYADEEIESIATMFIS